MSTFLVLFWVYFTCCFTTLIVLSFVASHSWFGGDQEWGFICTSFLTTPRVMVKEHQKIISERWVQQEVKCTVQYGRRVSVRSFTVILKKND